VTSTLLGLAALGGLALIAWRLRRRIAGLDDSLRQPKGWISADASLEEALAVADRHLATGRTGANVRLQYGRAGCLTMLRATWQTDRSGFVARWEFWRRDEDLARRLIALPAETAESPKPDVLELWFGEDYLSFRQAMSDAFSDMDIETGNMHLTWNC